MNPALLPSADASRAHAFLTGLVFGFDVGTGSLGWAVRQGDKFLDVGVLICPEDTNDLSGRRGLRRQRRTLRSRKYRREWFATELAKLGLPKPPPNAFHDPVSLRNRALAGEPLQPEELHAALAHLFKRRGYTEVPWKTGEAGEENPDRKKELGEIKTKMSQLAGEMRSQDCEFPSQLLARRREKGLPQRKEVWPRELLEKEFRAILRVQAAQHPKLAEKADWLLYGDTGEVKGHHVFFKNSEARNPGVLGLRWPRFDNRGPALDAFTPVDNEGRPLHVVRKNKDAFRLAQWELAVINFRVVDLATGALVSPDKAAIDRLREIWLSLMTPAKRKAVLSGTWTGEVKIELKRKGGKKGVLELWADEYAARYRLVDGQQPLTPQTGAGRARFASPTLHRLRDIIASGQRPDVAQPVLRRDGETAESALNRYLADIKHPLVRHRLILFRRLLADLMRRFGAPDLIVLEAVRSLALSQKNKRELQNRIKANRDERASIREELASRNASTSRKALLRYRLWKEAQSTCPFCGEKISQEQLLSGGADIEHLVPRSVVDCNEFYNLTVGHLRCNRDIKGDRTPYQAFAHTELWPRLRANAEKCFKGRKLEIFLSDKAEELIEQKADLQHTAYIARVIRHVALLQLNWLGEDGRDPTPEKQNPALRFQVTNGQLTSRLRQAWGLNHLLHPLPHGVLFHELPEEQQKQFQEKNRGDLRHHALDATVIACTLPWLAHRTHGATDEFGNHGWWTQDEKQRSKAANPLFPQEGALRRMAEEWMRKVVVRHHVSRSPHQSAYATTIYGKKAPNTYVAREVFTTLTPKNLGSIWPPEFAAYCEAAWARYAEEAADLEAELKRSKGCVPEAFARKLCFAHFQKWRADGTPDFRWPEQVKIPIRSVKLISVKDDTAVASASPGTHGFVKRTGFKEVRIHVAEDGKSFVPVFVPFWKRDKPLCERPIREGEKPVAVIQRGQVVQTKKPTSAGWPPAAYRILVTGQERVKLLPTHVANSEDSIVAFGLPKKALQVTWPDFVSCLGYELPHSPSAQPQPAGPDQAGPVAR